MVQNPLPNLELITLYAGRGRDAHAPRGIRKSVIYCLNNAFALFVAYSLKIILLLTPFYIQIRAVSFKGNVVWDIKYANYLTGYFKTYYTLNGEKTELYGDNYYFPKENQYDIYTPLNFTDGDIVTNVPLNVNDDISYTRTMTNEWGTLCLPFDVTYSRNESYKLYELTEATTETLTFTEYTDGTYISPGTPMAIKRISKTDDKVTISADENCVNTSLNNPASEAPSGAARMFSIVVPDDETTAIDDINAVFSGEASYYDLNGRRIDSLQQGVNIVKIGNRTKKVIIK